MGLWVIQVNACRVMCIIYKFMYFRLFVVLDEEINIFKFPNPIIHESRIATVFNHKGEIIMHTNMFKSFLQTYIHTYIHTCGYEGVY